MDVTVVVDKGVGDVAAVVGMESCQFGEVDVVRIVSALGQDAGLVLVEFILDNDLCRPIQSELVWPRWVAFSQLWPLAVLMLPVKKPFSFPAVVRCLEKLWGSVLLKMVLT